MRETSAGHRKKLITQDNPHKGYEDPYGYINDYAVKWNAMLSEAYDNYKDIQNDLELTKVYLKRGIFLSKVQFALVSIFGIIFLWQMINALLSLRE